MLTGRKRSLTFCGDGSCNGNEQPGSCPIDGCYQINSTCVNDTIRLWSALQPACCQTQHCCPESMPTDDSGGLNVGEIVGIAIGWLSRHSNDTYHYYYINTLIVITCRDPNEMCTNE